MRAWTGICVAVVVLAVALSGCIGTKDLPSPDSTSPALFVDYQRTGGFAGVNDRLVIFDNGVTLVSSRTTSREILLNRTELDRIASVFDAAGFQLLEGNYTSRRGSADLMQYSIRFRGRTVITEDTAVPASLEPVIQEMNRVLSTGMTRGQGDLSLPRIGP